MKIRIHHLIPLRTIVLALVCSIATAGFPQIDPLDQWHLRHEFPQPIGRTPKLSGILFANDTFIATGDNGLILSSTNGIDWQQRASGTTAGLTDLAFDGRVYVAVGTLGTILRSTDGISWSLQSSPTRVPLTGATFGKGLFVVVGGEQTIGPDRTIATLTRAILTSPDGITWTDHPNVTQASLGSADGSSSAGRELLSAISPSRPPAPPSTSGALYDVAFGNGIFRAVGGSGPSIQPNAETSLRSDDGLNWSGRTVVFPPVLRGITFGNGFFVSVGDYRALYVSSNTTGFPTDLDSNPNSAALHKVGFGGGTFVIVGTNGFLATSVNATNWITRPTRSTRGLHGIAFGRGTFVAVGESGTILQSGPQPSVDSPKLVNPLYQNGIFSVSVLTAPGRRYALEFTSDLAKPSWSSLPAIVGDGSVRSLSAPANGSRERFFRLRLE